MNDFEARYTPKTVEDIVFANEDSRTLVGDLISGVRHFPVREGKCGILLYGVPGTGKSALAKILPNAMETARTGGKAATRYVHVAPPNNGCNLISSIQRQAMVIPLATYHYFVLDEVDNLTKDGMASLKSAMNMPSCVFVMTTNNFGDIEVGVRDRCHCIAFNAASPDKWLPICHRLLNDVGMTGISDQALMDVIATGNGSARNILDAVNSVILKVQKQRTQQLSVV